MSNVRTMNQWAVEDNKSRERSRTYSGEKKCWHSREKENFSKVIAQDHDNFSKFHQTKDSGTYGGHLTISDIDGKSESSGTVRMNYGYEATWGKASEEKSKPQETEKKGGGNNQ